MDDFFIIFFYYRLPRARIPHVGSFATMRDLDPFRRSMALTPLRGFANVGVKAYLIRVVQPSPPCETNGQKMNGRHNKLTSDNEKVCKVFLIFYLFARFSLSAP